MREAKIEKYLKQKAEQYHGICIKCSSFGFNGVPDRIVLMDGKVYFVELKAPGKKTRKLQKYVHDLFRFHGVTVYVIDTMKGVDDFIHEICTSRLSDS